MDTPMDMEMETRPTAGGNGIGLAGFIVSLVGLVSCGLLSPVGIILSIFGLFKEPKGFAIAGLIIGLFGSLVIGGVVALFGLAMIFVLFQFGFNVGVLMDVIEIQESITEHYEATGSLPASLDELSLGRDALIDPWGNAYVYTPNELETGYSIVSAGEDGQLDTDDDLDVSFRANGDFDLEN